MFPVSDQRHCQRLQQRRPLPGMKLNMHTYTNSRHAPVRCHSHDGARRRMVRCRKGRLIAQAAASSRRASPLPSRSWVVTLRQAHLQGRPWDGCCCAAFLARGAQLGQRNVRQVQAEAQHRRSLAVQQHLIAQERRVRGHCVRAPAGTQASACVSAVALVRKAHGVAPRGQADTRTFSDASS